MKHTLHLKTGDYEFIEAEMEGTSEEAVEAFHGLYTAFHGGSGIETREYNKLLDEYLTKGSSEGLAAVWEEMSATQQGVFREIKKSKGRTNK